MQLSPHSGAKHTYLKSWSSIWSANPYHSYLAFGDKSPGDHQHCHIMWECRDSICWSRLSPPRTKIPVTAGVLKSAGAELVQTAALRSSVLIILLHQKQVFTPTISSAPSYHPQRTPFTTAHESRGYQLYACLSILNKMHSTFNKTFLLYVLCFNCVPLSHYY